VDGFHPAGIRSPILFRNVIEEKFESPAVKEQVREMRVASASACNPTGLEIDSIEWNPLPSRSARLSQAFPRVTRVCLMVLQGQESRATRRFLP
jgi:hypothetical protein